jgi:lysozyme family protein
MATTVAITRVDSTLNQFLIQGTIVLSGSYAANGDTVSFAADVVKTDQPPTFVEIAEQPATGTLASGFVYRYAVGSSPANGALQVFEVPAAAALTTAEPLSELAAGAYPAGLTGAKLIFRASFPKFI